METLKIETIQQKLSTKGQPYWTYKANGKTYGCWDKEAAEHIAKAVLDGKSVQVEITENESNGQKFRNIQKFVNVVDHAASMPVIASSASKGMNSTAMYVSYAKDIFIAMVEKAETSDFQNSEATEWLMSQSIALVKLAKSAFE